MVNPTRLVLLCSAWLAALIQVVFGSASHAWVDIGVIGFAGFVILTLPRLRRDTVLILLVLVVVGWFLLDHRPTADEWWAAGPPPTIRQPLAGDPAKTNQPPPTPAGSKPCRGATSAMSKSQNRQTQSHQYQPMRVMPNQTQLESGPPATRCTTIQAALD